MVTGLRGRLRRRLYLKLAASHAVAPYSRTRRQHHHLFDHSCFPLSRATTATQHPLLLNRNDTNRFGVLVYWRFSISAQPLQHYTIIAIAI